MTSVEVLAELLGRLAAAGERAFITSAELTRWPREAVAALKNQRLIVKTKPASSATCPGCEEKCCMPVHIMTTASGKPTAFVICDQRDDVHRVEVAPDSLEQWQISREGVARFVADSLLLNYSGKKIADGKLLELGMVRGVKKLQMLALALAGDLTLVAGDQQLSLLEVVGLADNSYSVDADIIKQLVDMSATGDPRYTPSRVRQAARKLDTQAMYEHWKQEYRELKRKKPDKSDSWYAHQIARMDIAQGRDAETIRKRMKQ